MLVTSHILAEIEANAHRVIALSRGFVLAEPVETVRSRLGGSRVTVRLPDPGVRRCLVGHIASAGLGSTERAAPATGRTSSRGAPPCRSHWSPRSPRTRRRSAS